MAVRPEQPSASTILVANTSAKTTQGRLVVETNAAQQLLQTTQMKQ
jgi:hypothetical protein